jgi:hypothetical protein
MRTCLGVELDRWNENEIVRLARLVLPIIARIPSFHQLY